MIESNHMARSWIEKLNDSKDLPKVVPLKGKMAARYGKGRIVVPSALCVDARMKQVRKGRLTTIDSIRDAITSQHDADMT